MKRLLTVKNRIRLTMLLLLLAAFALRVHRLDYQALRGDEAFAHLFAQQPLREMLPSLATTEPHPPLYYATLHLWTSLLGQGEFAARFLSVLVSILMVPMIYRLGSVLCGAKVGWLAALLGAINPFLIWHAQDVRMYSMLACLGLGSVLLFSLALEQGSKSSQKGLWGGYVILTVGALYVHYFSVFVLAIENLTVLCLYLFPRRRRGEETGDSPVAVNAEPGSEQCPEPRRRAVEERQRHPLTRWCVTQAVIAVLYVPWLLYVGKFILGHTKDWIEPVGLFSFLRRFFVVYSLGTTIPEDRAILLVWAFVIAFVLGCYGLVRLPKERAVTLGTYLFLPTTGIWLISLFRPIFDERYLIIVTPAYCIFLALGLGILFQWRCLELVEGMIKLPGKMAQSFVSVVAGGLLLALMLASSGHSLFNYFYHPAYAKSPDWRALVATLRQQSAPGDLVIHNYPDPALQYYLQGDLPLVVLPTSSPVDPVATAEALDKLAAGRQRLWLVPQPSTLWDADGFVENWLDRHCAKVHQETVGSLSLSLYLTPPAFLSRMTPINAHFDKVELAGYKLTTDVSSPQSGILTTTPNTALRLTLYWRVLAPMEISYTVFTHLLDANGQLWAQKDNPPVRGSYPTTEWRVGETIVDKYDIVIPPDALAGQYELVVGLYDATTGQRLPLLDKIGQRQDERVLLFDRIVVK
ncbi:MAG: glycosyltransferase family 39 protein [Anaerolineae bacterium]